MTISMTKCLSALKNGAFTNKDKIVVPFSKANLDVAAFLSKNRYISSYETYNNKTIALFLSYNDYKLPAISELAIVSKPERSIKFKKGKASAFSNGLSTSYFCNQAPTQKYGELGFILR